MHARDCNPEKMAVLPNTISKEFALYARAELDAKKARLRLAEALLTMADEDSRDVDVLRRAALQRMVLDYKRRSS